MAGKYGRALDPRADCRQRLLRPWPKKYYRPGSMPPDPPPEMRGRSGRLARSCRARPGRHKQGQSPLPAIAQQFPETGQILFGRDNLDLVYSRLHQRRQRIIRASNKTNRRPLRERRQSKVQPCIGGPRRQYDCTARRCNAAMVVLLGALNHRLVVHRQHVLCDRDCHRIQARARSPCQDHSLACTHAIPCRKRSNRWAGKATLPGKII
jgi:hypothetical protein